MWTVYMYRAFYFLVHSVYTIFEYAVNVLNIINITVVAVCHEVFPSQKNKQILGKLHKINKRPAHLTIVLGHEEASLKDVANLIIWCLASQISFISLYDYKGSLKKNEDELHYEVSRRKSKEDHVIWYNSDPLTYKNGFVGKKVHVKLISEEDGKNSVANLTKTIALSKNREISIQSVSESLYKKYEFPDPDLGLVCGETLSLYNYPPWQIRVTEFFTIKSLQNFTYSSFIEVLKKYSNCEQRLGK